MRPHFIIGNPTAPYLYRWYLVPKNRFFGAYLHKMIRSDDDRALHCHPWHNLSIMLWGSYREHTPDGSFIVRAGDTVVRSAETPHRLEVVQGPVWTIFIRFKKFREWGFHCPKGWRHWKQFVNMKDPGQVGPGCE